MILLSPIFALLGGVAALGVVAVHLITTREPATLLLPTARFVPPSTARATSRTARPSDRWLLLLRALSVLLLGLAFAGPVRTTRGPAVRTIVMVDASRAPASMPEVRDSAARWLGEGASLVVFDSAARELSVDSLAGIAATSARPSLTAALLAARRVAIAEAPSADSLRLVLVSPLTADAFDAATMAVRARWTGGLYHVAVAPRTDSMAPASVELSGRAEDVLRPALAAVRDLPAGTEVRIERGAAGESDTQWVRAGTRLLLVWPDSSVVGTAEGVTLEEGGTWVAPLGRLRLSGEGRVIARWADGVPAAIERSEGTGCVREVGILLPRSGDLTLTVGFGSLLRGLLSPCGGAASPVADSTARTQLLGASVGAMPSTLLRSEVQPHRQLALLLLIAALALSALEMVVRRRVVA